MQTIDNYITERLNPRHLGKSKFPIKGPIDNMIKFLEDNEFTEFDPGSSRVVKRINDQGKRGYMTDGSNKMLWFADTSKDPVSEDNPMLCFWTPDSNTFLYTEDVFQNLSQYGFKFFIADVITRDEIKDPNFFEHIKSHFDTKNSVSLRDIRIAQHLKLPDRLIKIVEQFKDKYCK